MRGAKRGSGIATNRKVGLIAAGMCGFAAFFESGRTFAEPLLAAADADLFHRGPDSSGRFSDEGAAMVFRRLAILDPEARSDQPMRDVSGRFVVVFNGEIYNYQALRRELLQRGVALRTQGDTECILEGFILWGEAVFDRLDGMFAVVIYDTRTQQVTAARDPLGIKPLYLARNGDGLAFSSEMRPLRRFIGRTEVDRAALAELLMFRYAAGRLSNLKGIELVPGGTVVRFSLRDKAYREHRFADVTATLVPDRVIGNEDALRIAEAELTSSVEAHLQSDVGYSVQLSGGVDSSLVLALASEKAGRRLQSYAVKLRDTEFDESRFREPVVKRYAAEHTELELGSRDFADALPHAVSAMEGPTPHFGCVMLMLLCAEIAKQHKVVLTGEAADEFFGGYDRYGRWRELQRHGRVGRWAPAWLWDLLPRYSYLRRFARNDAAVVASVYFDFVGLQRVFPGLVPQPGQRDAVAGQFRDFRDRLLAVDQTSYLSSLLMRQDRMAMAHGVEARVPYAHYPLARILNRIPRQIRVPGGETKPLLKAIARRWLPTEVVDRRKVGLALPLDRWLREEKGLGRYLELLTAADCRLATYAERGALVRIVDEFRKADANPGVPPLAHLVNMELWLRSLDTR